jgi:hypothetical protein
MFPIHRREFLQTTAVAGTLSLFGELPPVRAADAAPDPNLVRLNADIEPLVRLIEETPRNRLLEEIAGRIRGGLTYKELLAALLLAGVRNIQPRPNVGFKFHAVLVVNSAHLASLAAPDTERWLPLFWALDNFKGAQATNNKESGWRMRPVDESKVPTATKAAAEVTAAMDDWDVPRADAAAAAVARTLTPQQAFELFIITGARDFRDIGHKAIFAANAFRTLQTIGWQHAEPVLRSLAYAQLKHEGDNPAKRDGDPDRPGRKNRERAQQMSGNWADGTVNQDATRDLLAAIRTGDADAAPAVVAKTLDGRVSPRSAWDAVFLGAGELMLCQPNIVALHAATSANALHYAYENTSSDFVRRWLLLQAASFLTLFRDNLTNRKSVQIDTGRWSGVPGSSSAGDVVAELFAHASHNKAEAAQIALEYLKGGGDPQRLHDTARRLVFFKGADSHDYKFSSAILEDCGRVSPAWRNHYLAAGMMLFRGSGGPDIPLVERTRAAFRS